MHMILHKKIKVYVYNASAVLQQLAMSRALSYRRQEVSYSTLAVGVRWPAHLQSGTAACPGHPPKSLEEGSGRALSIQLMCSALRNLCF